MDGQNAQDSLVVTRWLQAWGLATLISVAISAEASAQEVWNDWSGPYVGLSFGAFRSTGEAERAGYSGSLLTLDVENGLFPNSIDGSKESLTGGIGLGINRQHGAFVSGVEIDISGLDHAQELKFSRVDPNPLPPFNGIDTNTAYRTEFGTLATLRARGGYAVGRNLYFATAGLAAGRVRNTFSLDLPDLGYSSPGWSNKSTRVGYVAGLGMERRMTEHLNLKAEVLYVDLADERIKGTDSVAFPGEQIDYKFKNEAVIARVGINFTF
ncbi:porin family protein (plasmid) [Pseudorhodobacter turbinis]|uniref:Porin family protein n=1 Tax=Pseudorhodobacter turbinis TaxID=2500533 RepID=A0A4P8EKE3_9RHOB|nr:outer membrane beta-barrel protein [Pseudorhodobacter turbinis]QCO57352.1 porin family protein [Pseudorhodobacter turbinis]